MSAFDASRVSSIPYIDFFIPMNSVARHRQHGNRESIENTAFSEKARDAVLPNSDRLSGLWIGLRVVPGQASRRLLLLAMLLAMTSLGVHQAQAQRDRAASMPGTVVQADPPASPGSNATAPSDLGLPSWAAPNASTPTSGSSWTESPAGGSPHRTSSGPGFPGPPQEVPISGTGLAALAAAGALYAVRKLRSDGEAEGNQP